MRIGFHRCFEVFACGASKSGWGRASGVGGLINFCPKSGATLWWEGGLINRRSAVLCSSDGLRLAFPTPSPLASAFPPKTSNVSVTGSRGSFSQAWRHRWPKVRDASHFWAPRMWHLSCFGWATLPERRCHTSRRLPLFIGPSGAFRALYGAFTTSRKPRVLARQLVGGVPAKLVLTCFGVLCFAACSFAREAPCLERIAVSVV
jgi:hypothetical protein